METLARPDEHGDNGRTETVGSGRRLSLRGWAVRAVLALAVSVAAGCATTHVPPPDLDLSRAAIGFDAAQPVLVLEGPSSKEVAVTVGAAGGMGTGVLVGALGCLGTGPFYAFCLALVLPATTVAGGLTGAMVGGIVSETDAAVEAKRDLFQTELVVASYPALLAAQVQQQARERFSIELPLLASTAPPNGSPISVDAGARTWRIELALARVTCGGAMPDQPFALRVEGRLRLRRGNESDAVYEASAMATSEASLTTAQWGANGAEAVRIGLDQSLRLLAGKLLSDLVRSGATLHSLGPVSVDQRGDL